MGLNTTSEVTDKQGNEQGWEENPVTDIGWNVLAERNCANRKVMVSAGGRKGDGHCRGFGGVYDWMDYGEGGVKGRERWKVRK